MEISEVPVIDILANGAAFDLQLEAIDSISASQGETLCGATTYSQVTAHEWLEISNSGTISMNIADTSLTGTEQTVTVNVSLQDY